MIGQPVYVGVGMHKPPPDEQDDPDMLVIRGDLDRTPSAHHMLAAHHVYTVCQRLDCCVMQPHRR